MLWDIKKGRFFYGSFWLFWPYTILFGGHLLLMVTLGRLELDFHVASVIVHILEQLTQIDADKAFLLSASI